MKNTLLQKVTAIVTLAFFSTGEAGMAAPPYSAQAAYPVSEVQAANPFKLELPPELGTIQNLHSGTGPVLIHLQTAHGNYEAQKKIQEILQYLHQNYGVETLFIEGSAVPLKPEYIRFFPDRMDITMDTLDQLAKDALIKGAELFLAEEKDAKAYGIENLESYLKNLKSFRTVIKAREETGEFLEKMDMQIERLSAPYLNQDLRQFLNEWERFEKHQAELMNWIRYVNKVSAGKNQPDVSLARHQIDWPMLFRILKLAEMEDEINAAKLTEEKIIFLHTLKKTKIPTDIFDEVKRHLDLPLSHHQLPDPETGMLFEAMADYLPQGFQFAEFPQVSLLIGHLILQSEIKADRLFNEIDEFSERTALALAYDENQKKLVAMLKDYRLLQRLFALELTPGDYQQIVARRDALIPDHVLKRFMEINQEQRVRDLKMPDLASVNELFVKALEFYEGTQIRDRAMLENIQRHLTQSKTEKAVVITGGFHSGPFEQFFQEKDYNYALISPKISTAEGHDAYLNALMGFQNGSSSTIESFSAALPRSELIRHGVVDPEKYYTHVIIRAFPQALNHDVLSMDQFMQLLARSPVFSNVSSRYAKGPQGRDGFMFSFLSADGAEVHGQRWIEGRPVTQQIQVSLLGLGENAVTVQGPQVLLPVSQTANQIFATPGISQNRSESRLKDEKAALIAGGIDANSLPHQLRQQWLEEIEPLPGESELKDIVTEISFQEPPTATQLVGIMKTSGGDIPFEIRTEGKSVYRLRSPIENPDLRRNYSKVLLRTLLLWLRGRGFEEVRFRFGLEEDQKRKSEGLKQILSEWSSELDQPPYREQIGEGNKLEIWAELSKLRLNYQELVEDQNELNKMREDHRSEIRKVYFKETTESANRWMQRAMAEPLSPEDEDLAELFRLDLEQQAVEGFASENPWKNKIGNVAATRTAAGTLMTEDEPLVWLVSRNGYLDFFAGPQVKEFIERVKLEQLTKPTVPYTYGQLRAESWNDTRLFYKETRDLLPGHHLVHVLLFNDDSIARSSVTEFFFINGVYYGYGVTKVFDAFQDLVMQFNVFPKTASKKYGRRRIPGLSSALYRQRLENWDQIIAPERDVRVHIFSDQFREESAQRFYERLGFRLNEENLASTGTEVLSKPLRSEARAEDGETNPVNIAVTGVSGDIGAHLLQLLDQEQSKVTAIVRDETAMQSYVERTGMDLDKGRFLEAELFDPALEKVIEKSDVFYHLASATRFDASAEEMLSVNGFAAIRLFKIAERLNPKIRFIFASTRTFYKFLDDGDNILRPDIHAWIESALNFIEGQSGFVDVSSLNEMNELSRKYLSLHPVPTGASVYEMSKLLAERYLKKSLAANRLTNFISVRISNAYGPGFLSGRAIQKWIEARLRGGKIESYREWRDYVHVQDLVRILYRAGITNYQGSHFEDIASGEVTAPEAIWQLIEKFTQLYIPQAHGQVAFIGPEIHTYRQNPDWARRMLGRKFIPITEGIASQIVDIARRFEILHYEIELQRDSSSTENWIARSTKAGQIKFQIHVLDPGDSRHIKKDAYFLLLQGLTGENDDVTGISRGLAASATFDLGSAENNDLLTVLLFTNNGRDLIGAYNYDRAHHYLSVISVKKEYHRTGATDLLLQDMRSRLKEFDGEFKRTGKFDAFIARHYVLAKQGEFHGTIEAFKIALGVFSKVIVTESNAQGEGAGDDSSKRAETRAKYPQTQAMVDQLNEENQKHGFEKAQPDDPLSILYVKHDLDYPIADGEAYTDFLLYAAGHSNFFISRAAVMEMWLGDFEIPAEKVIEELKNPNVLFALYGEPSMTPRQKETGYNFETYRALNGKRVTLLSYLYLLRNVAGPNVEISGDHPLFQKRKRGVDMFSLFTRTLEEEVKQISSEIESKREIWFEHLESNLNEVLGLARQMSLFEIVALQHLQTVTKSRLGQEHQEERRLYELVNATLLELILDEEDAGKKWPQLLFELVEEFSRRSEIRTGEENQALWRREPDWKTEFINQMEFRSEVRETTEEKKTELRGLRKDIFGERIDVWLNDLERGRDLATMERAAKSLANNEEFIKRIQNPGADFGVELLKFAVEKNINLGTTKLSSFAASLKKQATPSVKKYVKSLSLSARSYVSLIAALRHSVIQEYLESEAFLKQNREDRLGNLVLKILDEKLELLSENLKNIHHSLPEKISPNVRKKDIQIVEMPLSAYRDLRDLLKSEEIQNYLNSQEFEEAYREDRLAELTVRIMEAGLEFKSENLSQIYSGLPAKLSEKIAKQHIQHVRFSLPALKAVRSIIKSPGIQAFLDSDEFMEFSSADKLVNLVERILDEGYKLESSNLSSIHSALPNRLSNRIRKSDIQHVDLLLSVFHQVREALQDARIQEYLNSGFYGAQPAEDKLALLVQKIISLNIELDTEDLGKIHSALPMQVSEMISKKDLRSVNLSLSDYLRFRMALQDTRVGQFLISGEFQSTDQGWRMEGLVTRMRQLGYELTSDNYRGYYEALPAQVTAHLKKSFFTLPSTAFRSEMREAGGMDERREKIKTALQSLREIKIDELADGDLLSAVDGNIAYGLGESGPERGASWDLKDYIERMDRGLAVIPASEVPDPVETEFGVIDLSRLNDVSRYEGKEAALELARDLHVAHRLGLITISKFKGISPSTQVYRLLKKKEKKIGKINLPWPIAFVLREEFKKSVKERSLRHYSGNDGQLAFYKKVFGDKARQMHAGNLYSAISSLLDIEIEDEAGSHAPARKALGWQQVHLNVGDALALRADLSEKLKDRKWVENNKGDDRQLGYYLEFFKGKANQMHAGNLYSAISSLLDIEIEDEAGSHAPARTVLGWQQVNLNLGDALALSADLSEKLKDRKWVENNKGDAGQLGYYLEFFKEKANQLHAGHLYSAISSLLDIEIEDEGGSHVPARKVLGWKHVHLNLGDALALRADLREKLKDRKWVENNKGDAGQLGYYLEFFKEKANQLHAGHLYSAISSLLDIEIEDEEGSHAPARKALGWQQVNLNVGDAFALRADLSEKLKDRKWMENNKGDAGQLGYYLEFFKGKANQMHAGSLYSAISSLLDIEIEDEAGSHVPARKALGWQQVHLNVGDALALRADTGPLSRSEMREAGEQALESLRRLVQGKWKEGQKEIFRILDKDTLIKITGIYLRKDDERLLAEMSDEERERFERNYPSFTKTSAQPFAAVQVESTDKAKTPLAYIVFYPSAKGPAILEASKKSYSPGTVFVKIRDILRFKASVSSSKELRRTTYPQIIAYAAPHYFVKHYLESDNLLAAFQRTLEELREKDEFERLSLNESTVERVLKGFGFPVHYINSYHKLYRHYQSLGVDIRERFADLIATEKGDLQAFIKLMEELMRRDDFRLLNETNAQGVLTALGFPAAYISSRYKLYSHYQSLGVDISKRFAELRAEEEGDLPAFIKLMEELRQKDDFMLLNDRNLQGILTGFGFPVYFIHSHYKLYSHYQGLGMGIRKRFAELIATEKGDLHAFIKLMEELRRKNDFRLLNESNLQGVLTGFGFPVHYISSYYKLYSHYQNLGVDISERFAELRAEEEGDLPAFIKLMEELRQKDDFILLNEANLEKVLMGFGFPAAYIGSSYKLYRHWLNQGIDIGTLFTQKYYEERKPLKRVIAEIAEQGLTLPEGNFRFSLSQYIYYVLISLGKILKPGEERTTLPWEENVSAPSMDFIRLDLARYFEKGQISGEEHHLAERILSGYTGEEISRELELPAEETSGRIDALMSKLGTITRHASSRAEMRASDESALRLYQRFPLLQQYTPRNLSETLEWLQTHRDELGNHSLGYLVQALGVAGKLPEGEYVVPWQVAAGAYDFYLENSRIKQYRPQPLKRTLDWLDKNRFALANNRLAYLVKVLSVAGKLPEGENPVEWERSAAAYDVYLENELLQGYEPENLKATLSWIRKNQKALGNARIANLVEALIAAERLPPGASAVAWQRAAGAYDFYLRNKLLRQYRPRSLKATLFWLNKNRGKLGNNSINYLVQALAVAGRLPEGENDVTWQRAAGAYDFYLSSSKLQNFTPRMLDETLGWLDEHRAELGNNSLNYLMQALAVANRLPKGENPERWQFAAGAYDRALRDRQTIEAEIKRIWSKAPEQNFRSDLSRLRIRFDPKKLSSLKTGQPLSDSYRNLVLRQAYGIYGKDLIAQMKAEKTRAETYEEDIRVAALEGPVLPKMFKIERAKLTLRNMKPDSKFPYVILTSTRRGENLLRVDVRIPEDLEPHADENILMRDLRIELLKDEEGYKILDWYPIGYADTEPFYARNRQGVSSTIMNWLAWEFKQQNIQFSNNGTDNRSVIGLYQRFSKNADVTSVLFTWFIENAEGNPEESPVGIFIAGRSEMRKIQFAYDKRVGKTVRENLERHIKDSPLYAEIDSVTVTTVAGDRKRLTFGTKRWTKEFEISGMTNKAPPEDYLNAIVAAFHKTPEQKRTPVLDYIKAHRYPLLIASFVAVSAILTFQIWEQYQTREPQQNLPSLSQPQTADEIEPQLVPDVQAVVNRLRTIASGITNDEDRALAEDFIQEFVKHPRLDKTRLISTASHAAARIHTTAAGEVSGVEINEDLALYFPPVIVEKVMIHEGRHLADRELLFEMNRSLSQFIERGRVITPQGTPEEIRNMVNDPQLFADGIRTINLVLEDEWRAHRQEVSSFMRTLREEGDSARATRLILEGLGNSPEDQRRNAWVINYLASVTAFVDINGQPVEDTVKLNVLKNRFEAAYEDPEFAVNAFYNFFTVIAYYKMRGTAYEGTIILDRQNEELRIVDYVKFYDWFLAQKASMPRQESRQAALNLLMRELGDEIVTRRNYRLAEEGRILQDAESGTAVAERINGINRIYRKTHQEFPISEHIIKIADSAGEIDNLRLIHEAKRLLRLKPLGIFSGFAEIHAAGATEDGKVWIEVEGIPEARSFQEVLDSGTPLPLAQLFKILTLTADTLRQAHVHGIYHFNILPEHLLFNRNSRIQLIGFEDAFDTDGLEMSQHGEGSMLLSFS